MHIYNLISSDWHSGHDNGVMAPGTVLKYDDPGEPYRELTVSLTGGQDRLWNVTQNVLCYIGNVVGKEPIVLTQVGDIVNGNSFVETQYTRLSHQISIARAYLAEFMTRLNVSGFYTVHGTDVHSYGEGSAEELIAEYTREKYGVESVSASHLLLDVGGVRFDIAHDGPSVGEAWLTGNGARTYLRKRMMADMDVLQREPADVYVRAHVHGYADVQDSIERNGKFYQARLVVCPAMCIPNGYARKASRSISYYRLGMLLADIQDGRLVSIMPLLQSFDTRVLHGGGGRSSVQRRATRAS